MKVVESALQAVANRSAGRKKIEIATSGATVKDDGKVIPASSHKPSDADGVNGNGYSSRTDSKRKRGDESEEDTPPPKDRMDIILHNFNDERE